MGGMIAQQLTLNYPDKVDDLIIYASYCGGNQSISPNPELFKQTTNLSASDDDIKKSCSSIIYFKLCLVAQLIIPNTFS